MYRESGEISHYYYSENGGGLEQDHVRGGGDVEHEPVLMVQTSCQSLDLGQVAACFITYSSHHSTHDWDSLGKTLHFIIIEKCRC